MARDSNPQSPLRRRIYSPPWLTCRQRPPIRNCSQCSDPATCTIRCSSPNRNETIHWSARLCRNHTCNQFPALRIKLKSIVFRLLLFLNSIGLVGFEPTTSWSQIKRSKPDWATARCSAPGRTRTFNPRIKSPLRYQLRHWGMIDLVINMFYLLQELFKNSPFFQFSANLRERGIFWRIKYKKLFWFCQG